MSLLLLMEENRVLREQIGNRRLKFSDDQRRRLAAKAKEIVGAVYDRALFTAINEIRAVIEAVNKLMKCVKQANNPLLREEGWLRQ